jgi:hypothetical protein
MDEVKTGFAHKILSSRRGEAIYHIFGEDSSGRRVHLFVEVSTINRPKIDRALEAKELVDFGNCGNIVTSCCSLYPTLSVRQLLKEKYDIDV